MIQKIILDKQNLDFGVTGKKYRDIKNYWNEGYSEKQIAKMTRRKWLEIHFILIDLYMEKEIDDIEIIVRHRNTKSPSLLVPGRELLKK